MLHYGTRTGNLLDHDQYPGLQILLEGGIEHPARRIVGLKDMSRPRQHLLFFLLTAALSAGADDRITRRAVFEDTSAALDFQQVQPQVFTSYDGILSRGYSRSALWVRLHVEPDPGKASESLILRIRPGYLDEVRLYDPGYHSLGREVTGDRYPIAQDRYRSLNINLTIPQGERPRDIWLRIASTSTLLFQVQALSQAEALQLDRTQEISYSLYLATVGFFLAWGMAHWLSLRDRLVQAFVLKQAACLIFMIGFLGYARTFWPAGLTGWNAGQYTDWTFPFYVIMGSIFDYRLLRSFRAHRAGLLILRSLIAGAALCYLLLIFGQARLAFMILASVILAEISLTLVLAVNTPPPETLPGQEHPLMSRRALICLYLAIFLGFTFSSLPALGLTRAEFLVFDGFLTHSLISGVALLVVMMRRVRESERLRISAETACQFAERRAMDERHRRQEQAAFLTMLTHELKTPLAVVRMVLGARMTTSAMKAEAERSIRDMSNIIQRCTQVERLVDHAAQNNMQPCDLQEELTDLISGTPQSSRLVWQAAALSPIRTDPFLLRLIIANLIDNACKYSPDGSPITLEITEAIVRESPWLCIRVANRPGKAGWPDPQRVFQKYYRHPRAHEHTGSGLGLFLSARLAERLEGKLRYCPTQTEIRFELWIPR